MGFQVGEGGAITLVKNAEGPSSDFEDPRESG